MKFIVTFHDSKICEPIIKPINSHLFKVNKLGKLKKLKENSCLTLIRYKKKLEETEHKHKAS